MAVEQAEALLVPRFGDAGSAAFADGIDTGEDAGLRRVVERAGLDWTEAREHRDREGWRVEQEIRRRLG